MGRVAQLKFFLDCGAHDGSSVRLFRERTPDWREWQVHCWEPNPDHRSSLWGLVGATVHHKAVWVEDGERAFYRHRLGKLKAGSLISSKPDLDLGAPLTVPCVDFGRWVKRNCGPDDLVVLKLDIEGAEYRVLPQMIADGSIGLVDELYVEFHGHKTGVAADVHEALVADLRERGLEPKAWRT